MELQGIFDSHAHYDASAFDDDREALLKALPSRGVIGVVNAASDLASAQQSIKMARRWPYIRAAVGVHPEAAGEVAEGWLGELAALAAAPQVCAIGEIGLDYHWEDACPREQQQAVFRAQLALAKELDMPVIVHDRDAHGDVLALLTEFRPRGVVHCFSGSVEMMREVTALGMYIGLGGATTFKNAKRPMAVAAAVPIERLLLETDAPYMAPEPCRGKRCDSSLIAYTARHIAALRGMEPEELLQITAQNAKICFCL